MTPNKLVATIFGAVYVLVGLVGFLFTASVGFVATEGGLLLGIFCGQPAAQRGARAGRRGAALRRAAHGRGRRGDDQHGRRRRLPAGRILGLFIIGGSLNLLALNAADNVLHFLSAIVLLGVGLGARARARAVGRGACPPSCATGWAAPAREGGQPGGPHRRSR